MENGRPKHDNLRPRAVAVMVLLRGGMAGRGRISDALGDDTVLETQDLMGDLELLGLVQRARGHQRVWILTFDGVGWLESRGLKVADRAKREVSEAFDASLGVTL